MNPLQYWPTFFKNPSIGAKPRKILNEGDAIFTMGSCFALEVRRAVTALGYQAYPNYRGIPIEKGVEMFENIVPTDMPSHYDTFTMRQEIEAALGIWTDRAHGYWEITGAGANKLLNAPVVYQDPFRKSTFAHTHDGLIALSDRVTHAVREGLDKSRIAVFTLGLTEVWQDNATGRYICRPPNAGNGGGAGLATFKASKFQENYENMKAILDLLFERYPDKQVIISVSPVRLEKTFRPIDIGTANTESKSILRAVAGQIAEEYAGRVYYFPSYELAMLGIGGITGTGNVFEDDGRHVKPSFVEDVMGMFLKLVS